MDLEVIWTSFLQQFTQHPMIQSIKKQTFSGLPFIYIETNPELEERQLEYLIKTYSASVMKGKRLHAETIFVRKEGTLFVYRHRFYVPQEKMFCCGNLCTDCIRLKK